MLTIDANLADRSPKGLAEHRLYLFTRPVSVDGKKPPVAEAEAGAAYQGIVVRLNYARHGAANGVVLSTGDFIHMKPDGMRKLGLKVGNPVEVDGDAQFLATGHGWAVAATIVNGTVIDP